MKYRYLVLVYRIIYLLHVCRSCAKENQDPVECPVWRAVRHAVAVRGRAITAKMLYLFCPWDERTPVRTTASPATRHMSLSSQSCLAPCYGSRSVHNTTSRTVAQAVCRRLLTSAKLVIFKGSSCGIVNGQSGTGTGFSPKHSEFLWQYHFTHPPFSLTYRKMDGHWAR
jgi:hypothetical protein